MVMAVLYIMSYIIVKSVLMNCNLLSLQEDEVGGIDPIMRVWNLDKVCFLIFLSYTL